MRFLCIIVLLSLCICYAAASKGKKIRISSCDELRALGKHKVLKIPIKLTCDIDCEHIPFSPLKILFTKFDGQGHTIKNLNLRYNGKKKNVHQIGLFKSLASGAIVRNVTLLNVDVKGIRNVGAIAGNAHMAVVEHVTIDSNSHHGNKIFGKSNKVGALIGYAKDSTLSGITIKNTLVSGINKVGGVVGLFTGGTLRNVANFGFRNSSLSIVQGIKSVGGIVGESSSSTYRRAGVLRGVVFGESSVGGIAGKAYDTECADQLYVRRLVKILFRSNHGSEIGGFFGSYLIEGDSKYIISNSYTKATIMGKDKVGGIAGVLSLDTPDVKVTLENLIIASPIKNAPLSGKLIGVLNYNPSTQTLNYINVYFFTGFNSYLEQVGILIDSPSHGSYSRDISETPVADTKEARNSPPVPPAGVPEAIGAEQVEIVEAAIARFDQDHIWCQDRLRGEQGFQARHEYCRCGPYSQDYDGKCLCSSFTELSANPSYCINSTGSCESPWFSGTKFVPLASNIFVELNIVDAHFVESGPLKGNLEVHLNYTAQATAWTDIVVLGRKGVFVASLSNFLMGKGFQNEVWNQAVDKTGTACGQLVSFSLPWTNIAALSQVDTLSGDFAFRIFAHTNLLREEKKLILRDLDLRPNGDSAEIITAAPLLISLNTSVTTDALTTSTLKLSFNVSLSYYVKRAQVDNTGTKLTVVLGHSVDNPLSLIAEIVEVTVDGTVTTARITGSNAVDCPAVFNVDNRHKDCEQETIFEIDLPLSNTCGDHNINFRINLNASCSGPNHVESTLCPSVYQQVENDGHVSNAALIEFVYTFCPKIEETTLTTSAFTIYQEGKCVLNGGELESGHPLNGTITLDVLTTVVDSCFESANIKSILLYEKVPSKDTLPFLDVTGKATLESGWQPHPNQVQISFSYIPRVFELTKKLKNWFTGLYFVVTIDVNYQPEGLKNQGKSEENAPVVQNTVVRLEVPFKPHRRDLGVMASAESTKATSTEFKMKESKSSGKRNGERQDTEMISAEKGQRIEQQLKSEAQKNQIIAAVMIVSMCLCAVIIVGFVGFLVYSYTKKGNKQNEIQLQTN